MEKDLNILQHIHHVEPRAELGAKIWGEILRQKTEIISWYKVAIAACFVGGMLFAGIYAYVSNDSRAQDQLLNAYQLSNSYDLYHE